jgi:hypothetical protein
MVGSIIDLSDNYLVQDKEVLEVQLVAPDEPTHCRVNGVNRVATTAK